MLAHLNLLSLCAERQRFSTVPFVLHNRHGADKLEEFAGANVVGVSKLRCSLGVFLYCPCDLGVFVG